MPFYAIIGIIWALMVIGIGQWGRQRNLDVTLLKAIQAILTIVALAIVAPDLGIFKTILAILWLFLFLAVSSLMQRFRVTMPPPSVVGGIAVGLALVAAESLNIMLVRTLIMLALSSIFLLGMNLGFKFLIYRILWIFPILFAVSVITFSIMHAVPGGPFDAGGETGGIPLTPEVRANLMRKYNLDGPLYLQYISWVGNVLKGDFGFSFQHQSKTCQELIAQAWPVSVHLGLMALVVALSGGLILGILSAVYQNTWIDYLASLSAIFSIVTPSFVIAVGLTLVFSLWLHWFDTGGWNSPKDWVMPVVAMALGDMAVIARYTRSNMIETIRADYVRTARAKGLTETSVVVVHVFKNALIPLLTITGPMMANLITGSFFIETIFRIPGLGRYFTTSVFARDYPMIMATALLWSSLIVVIYVLTDIMYALADPRIRYRKD
ncbi:MAG: ABC transporter permease [Gemmatimonadota bacterium]|jgi:ABC-type dipeptide/oligopeptide/nickel transport system permease component|nr:ABC transporter permease [Gemmatimonadota bacterium]